RPNWVRSGRSGNGIAVGVRSFAPDFRMLCFHVFCFSLSVVCCFGYLPLLNHTHLICFALRGRNAAHSVEDSRTPLRIFWNQEDFAVPVRGGPCRKAVTPATSKAADEVHAATVLAR